MKIYFWELMLKVIVPPSALFRDPARAANVLKFSVPSFLTETSIFVTVWIGGCSGEAQ